MTAAVGAVDVGGTTIKSAIIGQDGERLWGRRVPTPPAAADSVEAVLAAVAEIDAQAAAMHVTLGATGVIVPGRVDTGTGTCVYAANLGWRSVPLGALASSRTTVPVAIGHDVRAASLAAVRYGGAPGRNVVVLQIGTGIASIAIADGRLVDGHLGLAGEIGHIPVHPDGEPCPCGQRGCLERYASAASIGRRYVAAGGPDGSTAADVLTALETDERAQRVWADAVHSLGLALATVTMLFDPELVLLTGGLSLAGPALTAPLRAELRDLVVWRDPPRVEVSRLRDEAGLAGAAMLGRERAGHDTERWLS